MSTTETDIDISTLNEIVPTTGEYEAPSEFFRPPEPGKETIIRDGDAVTYINKKDGVTTLSINAKFKILGGLQDGRTFFTFIGTRQNKFRNANDAQDYLLAMGYTERLVTIADYKAALETTILPADVLLTWESDKCSTCDKNLYQKLKDFPKRSDGSYQHVTKCKDCGEAVGAKVRISKFLPK